MITSLRIVDFKNFADATLHLGPLTLVIGTNASGKSNIGDALRFLSRLPSGRNVNEIIGGYRDWLPIRGAMNEVTRFGENLFQLHVDFANVPMKYQIDVGVRNSEKYFETLFEMFDVGTDKWGHTTGRRFPQPFDKTHLTEWASWSEPVVNNSHDQLTNDLDYLNRKIAISAKNILSEIELIRVFDFDPKSIRKNSISGDVQVGDTGENVPTVLRRLSDHEETKTVLESWLAEISPMEISHLKFDFDEAGYTYFSLIDGNGQKISARSASDGTLRYLAYLAAILDAKPGSTFFFEEIDTGIHPTRLHLLLEFMESQAKAKDLRIIVTTHSPLMLDLASDETFDNSSLVYRGEDGTGKIKRFSEFPNLRELRKKQGLGRLQAAGWFENVASFMETPKDEE